MILKFLNKLKWLLILLYPIFSLSQIYDINYREDHSFASRDKYTYSSKINSNIIYVYGRTEELNSDIQPVHYILDDKLNVLIKKSDKDYNIELPNKGIICFVKGEDIYVLGLVDNLKDDDYVRLIKFSKDLDMNFHYDIVAKENYIKYDFRISPNSIWIVHHTRDSVDQGYVIVEELNLQGELVNNYNYQLNYSIGNLTASIYGSNSDSLLIGLVEYNGGIELLKLDLPSNSIRAIFNYPSINPNSYFYSNTKLFSNGNSQITISYDKVRYYNGSYFSQPEIVQINEKWNVDWTISISDSLWETAYLDNILIEEDKINILDHYSRDNVNFDIYFKQIDKLGVESNASTYDMEFKINIPTSLIKLSNDLYAFSGFSTAPGYYSNSFLSIINSEGLLFHHYLHLGGNDKSEPEYLQVHQDFDNESLVVLGNKYYFQRDRFPIYSFNHNIILREWAYLTNEFNSNVELSGLGSSKHQNRWVRKDGKGNIIIRGFQDLGYTEIASNCYFPPCYNVFQAFIEKYDDDGKFCLKKL